MFRRAFSSRVKIFTANSSEINKLNGTMHKNGIELTKERGEFLNNFWRENPFYQFLGCSTGISAVNVVAGGRGRVGPYVGGWQINAMKNRLQETMPDTLHVSPEEPANCATEVNNHIWKADAIQLLNNDNSSNYHNFALLADLEQGWSTPEKTRLAVKRAIQSGINIMHIEDQGPFKRCGHLGDKELCPIVDYELIMKSANFAAQEMLGSEQPVKNWVRFVARTDALSAKRILYSKNLEDKNHIDNKFIDWKKGFSGDGKYLFLKQGINPETGKKYGLEMSIARTSYIVKKGLASLVWMETPDADLNDAKDYISGVNNELAKVDMYATGLYNHSPSFDWDVKFYENAKKLAKIITEKYKTGHLRGFLELNGDTIQGDNKFDEKGIKNLELAIQDFRNNKQYKYNFTEQDYYLNKFQETNFKTPYDVICDEIVTQRLKLFENQLANFGYNAHLITLPEYHVMAFGMFRLAEQFHQEGIWAYVNQIQRPERIKFEEKNGYKYYKHQTMTGTGLESYFNQCVGSSNNNILSGSTETDDAKKRCDEEH